MHGGLIMPVLECVYCKINVLGVEGQVAGVKGGEKVSVVSVNRASR